MNALQDIVEEHLAELGFLWRQRRDALQSPLQTPGDLSRLDERIAAHLDGILSNRGDAVPCLRKALRGDEPEPAFAAAWSMLHVGDGALAQEVVQAFVNSEGPRLIALAHALEQAPVNHVLEKLRQLMADGAAPAAAMAASVLAYHGQLARDPTRLSEFMQDPDPNVRRCAWRIATFVDSVSSRFRRRPTLARD